MEPSGITQKPAPFKPALFAVDSNSAQDGAECSLRIMPGLKVLVRQANGVEFEKARTQLRGSLQSGLRSGDNVKRSEAELAVAKGLAAFALVGWNQPLELGDTVYDTPHPTKEGWYYSPKAVYPLLSLNIALVNEVLDFAVTPENYTVAANRLTEDDKSFPEGILRLA